MDLPYFCEQTFNFTSIPLFLYRNGHLTESFHNCSASFFPPQEIADCLIQGEDPVQLYGTNIPVYYGKIAVPDSDIVILAGPSPNILCREEDLRDFFHRYHIPSDIQDAYQAEFSFVPIFPLYAFCSLLQQMYHAITGERCTVMSAIPQEVDSGRELLSRRIERMEDGYHNTIYDTLIRVSPLIAAGDIHALEEYSRKAIPMNYGKFSKNAREQSLVILILSVFMSAFSVIDGGIDQQTALAMAEMYIFQGLLLKKPAEIEKLSIRSTLDFTMMARKGHRETQISPIIRKCAEQIQETIYTPVTVADLAVVSGFSQAHFSKRFKHEIGMSPSQYILKCKIDESKRLLQYSGLSIAEISSLLYFSNQSHFQRVFKSSVGCTPLQYRNKEIAGSSDDAADQTKGTSEKKHPHQENT